METMCKYCGSSLGVVAGGYCSQSPTQKHVLTEKKSEHKCQYCGSSLGVVAGGFCSQSPTKKHVLI